MKPTPAASVLTPTQNPSLSITTLLGASAPGPSFAPRHPLSLGPASLLDSLENHVPLGPPVLPTPAGATGSQAELLLSSPAQAAELAGLAAPPEAQRQVFVRYDKEEPEDVEISLESDSDDSVVIMPQGMMLEMHEGAANAQSLAPPVGSVLPVPNAGLGSEAGTVDASLSSELPTSIGHQMLPADANNINSFPGSSQTEQLVSLVPPLNSNAVSLSASTGALGNSLPAGAQLQQMLMQSSPGGQPSQLGLSLHMQLQNQLVQSSRQPAANEQDQNVININSTDDEEEEDEEMEDEDELEEEEEEGLEEEEDDEEGSDFLDDGFYQEGQYETFDDVDDDEGEDMEEEEEEEEDDEEEIQPVEADNLRDVIGAEEGEVMIEGQEGRGVGTFPVESERLTEGGIEEMKAVQSIYDEEGIKDKRGIEQIENIGAVERNENEAGEQQIETQVIGAEGEQSEENASVEAGNQEVQSQEPEGSRPESVETPEDSDIPPEGQEQEVAIEVKDTEPSVEAEQVETPNQSTATTSDDTAAQQGVETAEKEVTEGTQAEEEEARGTKRKIEDREEGEVTEQSSEKKKVKLHFSKAL